MCNYGMYPFIQSFNEHLYDTQDRRPYIKIIYKSESINRSIIYDSYAMNLSQSLEFFWT